MIKVQQAQLTQGAGEACRTWLYGPCASFYDAAAKLEEREAKVKDYLELGIRRECQRTSGCRIPYVLAD